MDKRFRLPILLALASFRGSTKLLQLLRSSVHHCSATRISIKVIKTFNIALVPDRRAEVLRMELEERLARTGVAAFQSLQATLQGVPSPFMDTHA